MRRRDLLGAAGGACWAVPAPLLAQARFAELPMPARVRAQPGRLIDFQVGLRPFRAQGPRIEAQALGRKTVVHHYGHGGSGWSLSWGSALLGALPLIRSAGERRIAVIGCGVIGLTTARVAQQAGCQVRIYARERPPEVTSSAATGVWSPDSRIVTAANSHPAFEQRWEAMARRSFQRHQHALGTPGAAAEWHDGYLLSDVPFEQDLPDETGEPEYPDLAERVADLRPRSSPLRPDEHPFRVAHARRFTQLVFNLGVYQRELLADFHREGGQIVQADFQRPRDLLALPEPTLVNCTGYGARALFGDNSLIPVRGQTARLIPQPEVDYALHHRGHRISMVPRRDGLLVQVQTPGDFGNADTRIDRALAEAAVQRMASWMV